MLAVIPSASDLQVRSFARRWLPLFCVLVSVSLVWRHGWTATTVLAIGGLSAILLICAASVIAARRLFVALQMVTWPIGVVVSTTALALVFYLVVTPIGLVLRSPGRDPLRLRSRHRTTHWLPTVDDRDPDRAFRQF